MADDYPELSRLLREAWDEALRQQERLFARIDYRGNAAALDQAAARTRQLNAVIRHLGEAMCAAGAEHVVPDGETACLLCGENV